MLSKKSLIYQMQNNPLRATDPDHQASVQASAGTGKTWMLITRILKLLLHGVEPGRILALTFTRKAAAEMLTRLSDRSREWSAADDKTLTQYLKEVGLTATPELMQQARCLYEKLLYCQYPVRVSTFHAFAQELLQRFVLEAKIPPAFDLLVDSYELEQEAWARVNDKANRISIKQNLDTEDQALLADLQYLFQECGSVDNTKNLLNLFINNRIDWWAFSQEQAHAIEFACQSLRELLLLNQQQELDIERFLSNALSHTYLRELNKLKEFLKRHGKRNELKQIERIDIANNKGHSLHDRFDAAYLALFKKDGTPFKVSAALAKSIGDHDLEDFHLCYDFLVQSTEKNRDLLQRLQILRLSTAWFRVGNFYLTKFQQIKQERRVLDFGDLEWKTYQLLNQGNNARWVQYKLDQRIDHLLVDEFQDTNPTQWHLLLPFLNEMAATKTQELRSIFIVGDTKQSIYQFRRANPKLLNEASEWLNNTLAAQTYQLSSSRRSSPVVIDVVNQVFLNKSDYPGFQQHGTYQQTLWGQVGVLPLSQEAEGKAERESFRNPLIQARASKEKQRYIQEANLVVNKIQELVDGDYCVKDGDTVRSIEYSDIMILVRKRTNAHYFEKILTERKIPFIGTDRGNLLNCLEVQDMVALLSILINPHDNLLMAQVLRSPLFQLTEQELLQIAEHAQGSWYQSLQLRFSTNTSTDSEQEKKNQQQARLYNCYKTLKNWRKLAGKLPVHDLLDKLYHQTNIVARYEKTFPEALRPRLRANFSKFIDLALDLDSGRYPSIPRFLDHIKTLKLNPQNAPDTPPSDEQGKRLQILTVHSSKGLESPVLFIVDACEQAEPNNRFYNCINWPSTSTKPMHFFLTHSSCKNNPALAAIVNPQAASMKLEDDNLLYVALTRAKQYLYISGSLGTRQKELGWYGQLLQAVKTLGQEVGDECLYDYLEQPLIDKKTSATQQQTNNIARGYADMLTSLQQNELENKRQISSVSNRPVPSRKSNEDKQNSQAQNETLEQTSKLNQTSLIGQVVHRILELKTQNVEYSKTQINQKIRSDYKLLCTNQELESAWQNVQTTLNDKNLSHFFDANSYTAAYNEMPISYYENNCWTNGIIDRLVIKAETIYLIDYKSHHFHEHEQAEVVAKQYRSQLKAYASGVQQIWPKHNIVAVILFTQIATACQLQL